MRHAFKEPRGKVEEDGAAQHAALVHNTVDHQQAQAEETESTIVLERFDLIVRRIFYCWKEEAKIRRYISSC